MNENDYVRQVLNAFRQTPTTAGHIRHQDRLLAIQLFRRGVPLRVVENALVLGASRRLFRDLDLPPLPPVQSLRYFLGIVDEILALKACPPGYFDYLRYKIKTFEECKQRFLEDIQSQRSR